MRLVMGDSNGQEDDGLDTDDAADQEQEAVAYRFTQILPDQCEVLASNIAHSGIDHPVIFLCDVGDHFGLAIARKITTSGIIEQALKETGSDARPGVLEVVDIDDFEGKEPTIFHAIKSRMAGLIGYFAIVVAAKGGFTVFPWPYKLKDKSKFKLFSQYKSLPSQ